MNCGWSWYCLMSGVVCMWESFIWLFFCTVNAEAVEYSLGKYQGICSPFSGTVLQHTLLKNNRAVPQEASGFISSDQWLSNSPDLNPMLVTRSGLQFSSAFTRRRFATSMRQGVIHKGRPYGGGTEGMVQCGKNGQRGGGYGECGRLQRVAVYGTKWWQNSDKVNRWINRTLHHVNWGVLRGIGNSTRRHPAASTVSCQCQQKSLTVTGNIYWMSTSHCLNCIFSHVCGRPQKGEGRVWPSADKSGQGEVSRFLLYFCRRPLWMTLLSVCWTLDTALNNRPIDQWRAPLIACTHVKCGHFEHILKMNPRWTVIQRCMCVLIIGRTDRQPQCVTWLHC